MQRVKLTKLKEAPNPEHPNNRPEGEVNYGWLHDEPEVDKCFYLDKGPRFYFRTSVVQEIIDENTFRTCNSIYQIERLPE